MFPISLKIQDLCCTSSKLCVRINRIIDAPSQTFQFHVLRRSGKIAEWKTLSKEVGKYTFSAYNEAVIDGDKLSDHFNYLK
jgi:hypothetical protein